MEFFWLLLGLPGTDQALSANSSSLCGQFLIMSWGSGMGEAAREHFHEEGEGGEDQQQAGECQWEQGSSNNPESGNLSWRRQPERQAGHSRMWERVWSWLHTAGGRRGLRKGEDLHGWRCQKVRAWSLLFDQQVGRAGAKGAVPDKM